jgi:general secretion pathway protein I
MKRQREQRKGFTLLEIVIAFAILGLAAGVIVPLYSPHQQRLLRSANERIALLTAKTLLDSLDVDIPLSEGMQRGSTPLGATWEVLIEGYKDPEASPEATASPLRAYKIRIRSAAGKGVAAAETELSTLRLKPETE